MDNQSGKVKVLPPTRHFKKAVTSTYETVAGENHAILGDLTSGLEKIFNAGPSQTGMSPAELAVQNSQAINSAAAAQKQVQQAIGEKAGTSGAPGVESGVVQAERSTAATQVENNLSNQEAAITQKNYDIGRSNYNTATEALMKAPGELENPVTEAGNSVNTADKDTADQANANAQANQQLAGMVMGIAGDATGMFAGSIGGPKIPGANANLPLNPEFGEKAFEGF